MSRALDLDVPASASATNSRAVYDDVVQALNSSTVDLLDIEFLGKSHPLPPDSNILVDGHNIGVPKVQLVRAFVIARQIFFKSLEAFNKDHFHAIRNSTAVILLMDPEHITAINARKKIIQNLLAYSETDQQGILRRELFVLDSFLTSRLHRHTKSPTLWGHRRWILEVLYSLKLHRDIKHDVEAVVLVAAGRHSRNYYAWLHLRWLLQRFQSLTYRCSRSLATFDDSNIRSVVKDWCLRHPADTSGWSFLLFYLSSIEPPTTRLETSSSICREVLGLATSFKWTHESVWVFLRTLVASGNFEEDQQLLFFKTIAIILPAQSEDPKAREILMTSHDWCVEHSV